MLSEWQVPRGARWQSARKSLGSALRRSDGTYPCHRGCPSEIRRFRSGQSVSPTYSRRSDGQVGRELQASLGMRTRIPSKTHAETIEGSQIRKPATAPLPRRRLLPRRTPVPVAPASRRTRPHHRQGTRLFLRLPVQLQCFVPSQGDHHICSVQPLAESIRPVDFLQKALRSYGAVHRYDRYREGSQAAVSSERRLRRPPSE